tara:strand:+ start:195 stop:656 length:462 start_codon:yes stop_codon:yes gene_type:complete
VIVEYVSVRPDAHCPTRGHPSDAGLDVYYSPTKGDTNIVIRPGDGKVIPTGLRFGVPHGYMLEVKNRSSVAAKRSLIVGACVIDSGYDGEVFINLHNIGKCVQIIEPGEKIAQLVMIPVVHFRALKSADDHLYDDPITISNRGDGALGSTNET